MLHKTFKRLTRNVVHQESSFVKEALTSPSKNRFADRQTDEQKWFILGSPMFDGWTL